MSGAAKVIYRPLIPVTVVLLVGIGLGARYPGRLWPVAAATLLCASLVLASVLRRRAAVVLPLLFCLGVGYLLPQPWLAANLAENHVSRFADSQEWIVSGTIHDRPVFQRNRLQFSLAVERLRRGDQDVGVRGNIRVTVGSRLPALAQGQSVVFSGRLRPIRNFNNPGGFDYVRYMALEDMRARTYTAGEHIRIESPGAALSPVVQFRGGLIRKMNRALQNRSADAGALLGALILGERNAVNSGVREAFARSGLAHLLAISGLHVGMVATVAFGAAAWGLAWLPPMLRRAWTRRGAALCAFCTALVYSVLAGLSPATQRALVMCSAVLLTYWISRRHDWANALALAALIIVLVMPPVALGPSFQLSFAAVAAILGGLRLYCPAVAADGKSIVNRIFRHLASLGWISLLATLGTLPLVMYYFNQVSLVGPVVNLVAVPAVGGLVLPAGLLGVLFSFFSDALAALCWQIAAQVLEILLLLVDNIAVWPPAAVRTITPTLVEIALYGGAMVLIATWRQRGLRTAGLTVLLTVSLLDAAYWLERRFDGHRLTVQALDVGQGSANLLQLPGGYTVLIDGGGFSDNAGFDVGKYIVAPFLWRQKIAKVDLVILTHPNSDHLNGLLYILENFDVGEIWSNQELCDLAGCREWRDLIQHRGIYHPSFADLPLETERHGVSFGLLNPPHDYLERCTADSWRDANNNSLVVKVTWGNTKFLFTGDIGRPAEAEILARHTTGRLASTILIAPHHGSRTSCTQPFLAAVRPQEAIIPVGWDNRFGFPHQEVLERLKKQHCQIWRTDLCGAVRVVTDGHSHTIAGYIGQVE